MQEPELNILELNNKVQLEEPKLEKDEDKFSESKDPEINDVK